MLAQACQRCCRLLTQTIRNNCQSDLVMWLGCCSIDATAEAAFVHRMLRTRCRRSVTVVTGSSLVEMECLSMSCLYKDFCTEYMSIVDVFDIS